MQWPTKIGIAGAALSLLGAGFGWGIFPWFLSSQIAKSKGLVKGGETRGYWEKAPIPAEFKVYIFNVTNHLAVHNGDTPMLDEIGPFWYDEWKDKADIVDYEEDDTVTFHMKTTFIFRPELTAPLTGNETVIVPHPALVGMVGATERTKPGVLGLINKAIPALFNQPETIFLKTTVYDLLFGGNVINCTSKDFAASAICTFLKKEGKDLEKVSDTIFKFSIFGSRNATPETGVLQVNRGIIDYKKVGEMVSFNGKKKMSVWRGKPCNNLFGTDSTIFKPLLEPSDVIAAFAPDLCRSIVTKFESFSEYKGIKTLRYNATLGDMSSDPSLKCFCPNETYCLKQGVMDLGPCTGAPAIVSFPHFFDAHEDYVKAVRGLHPDKEKHGIFLDMEPLTGSPINARKRLQFSLPIHAVNKVDITKNLPSVFLPFMWVEEGASLNDEWVAKFDGMLFRVLRIVDAVRWSLTVIGAVIAGGGIGLYYKRKNNLLVSPTTGNKKSDAPNEFLGEKESQNNLDGGINNYGYM